MNVALWLLAGFAAVEGVAVATSGSDVFYAVPIPAQDRALPAAEWLLGAGLFAVAALRTAPVSSPTVGY